MPTDTWPATLDDYSRRLAQRGITLDALAVDERGTLCLDPVGSAPPSTLLELEGTPTSEIVLRSTLARGGLGEVVLALQASLGREVAVKRARPGEGGTQAELELVREGQVTGHLEHPNIVPVHLLGRSQDGKPLLVMKRIEGQTWSQLLRAGRDLRRDVRILIDVCRALHFAHSRGILHRDVKPANVMVGSFGEVYLVDWGIAVAISDKAPPEVPRAAEVASIAGTPGYLAPEMALGGGLDARTDVFLSGAVLYEVMQGTPPFHASSVQASLLKSASGRPPPLLPELPEELVAICRRAMATEPDDRYGTCDALRVALEEFLSHSTSRELCAEAEERLARIRDLPPDADARTVLQLLSECRFGFTMALRGWPESKRAPAGLAAALETVARREVAAGRFESARLLVAELGHVPADLAAALQALGRQREREVQSVDELARVAHDTDRYVGDIERARLLYASAITWAVLSPVFAVLAGRGIYEVGAGTLAIWDVLSVASVWALRLRNPHLVKTDAARAAFMSIVVSLFSLLVMHLACFALQLPIIDMLVASTVLLGGSIADRASVDPRVWPSAVIIWGAVPLMILFPEHGYLIGGWGVAIGIAGTAVVARDAMTAPPPARQDP